MPTSRLVLLLLPCLTIVFADRSLSIMLMHLENIQGVVQNGTQCSPFSFAGVQCSMEMTVCVDIGNEYESNITCYALGQVSHSSNKVDFTESTYGEWTNPLTISLEGITYHGFRLEVTLTDVRGEEIDEWNATYANASQLQDIYTYTSHRDGFLGTSLTVAWTTNEVLPPTPPPTTPSTTTGTVPTTTQGNVTEPRTCDEFWNRTDGVKIIYINGKQINVYCQYGTTGAYTVIQSRGSLDDTTFNRKLEEYRSSFGIPGKGNNFWLGLDNMVALTSQGNYDLLIELCCSGTNSIQFYKNFTISQDYVLRAEAIVPTIGLDYISSNTGKKDIGVPFTTYDKMDETMRESCDIVRYYGSQDKPIFDAQTGGWWFGSCGNNLNGEFVPKANPTSTCQLDEKFSGETSGIEMRTTTGQVGPDGRSFDGISYNRVRMAIYRSGKTPVATQPFCT